MPPNFFWFLESFEILVDVINYSPGKVCGDTYTDTYPKFSALSPRFTNALEAPTGLT